MLRLLLVLLVVLAPLPGFAHWADMATAETQVEGPKVRMLLTLPTGLLGPSDFDGDGRLGPDEVEADASALAELLNTGLIVKSGGETGTLQVRPWDGPPPEGERHSRLQLEWSFPGDVHELDLEYRLFHPDAPDAHCLATVQMDGQMHSFVFKPKETRLRVGASNPWGEAATFLKMGVEHLVTGYDHVLFLLALLLAGGTIRYLVATITAFTVAHTITLTLAVLDVVRIPPAVVEPLIAASIIYAALENFWRKKLDDRWIVAFLFGLVHGVGFAGILREGALSGGNLLLPLASFNLGVELGQLAVVVPVYFLFRPIFADELRGRRFTRVASALVAMMGLYWLLERVGVFG